MRYYNDTQERIKYVCFDFDTYIKEDFLNTGHYIPRLPMYKGKKLVVFDAGNFFFGLKREDFDKLKKVKDNHGRVTA